MGVVSRRWVWLACQVCGKIRVTLYKFSTFLSTSGYQKVDKFPTL